MSFYLRIFVLYVLLEFRNGVSCRVFNAQNCQYFQEINIACQTIDFDDKLMYVIK